MTDENLAGYKAVFIWGLASLSPPYQQPTSNKSLQFSSCMA